MVDYPGARFAEVECRANSELCGTHSAGKGGWPTIKYFNAATGPNGAFYKQKTKGMICDELKIVDNMKAYVTETVAEFNAHLAASKGAATSEL